MQIIICFFYRFANKTPIRHLVVFLLCQQVVESLVDRLVVVTLDRPQVGLHQLQLVHLVHNKQTVRLYRPVLITG